MTATGLRLLPWTATPMVIAPLAGTLADRIGTRPLPRFGGAFAIAIATATFRVPPRPAAPRLPVPPGPGDAAGRGRCRPRPVLGGV
jgi:hypothetical protein